MRPPRSLPAILVALAAAPASAQPGLATPDTDWVFDADAAHAGSTVRAAIQFSLPGKYHVQSNQPTDEYLIPTVLTVTPPSGFTVIEVVYPQPVLFEVLGFDELLPVFDQTFVIGLALEIDADVRPGTHVINGALGYQACDDKQCLMPTTMNLSADLEVVPVTTQITRTDSPLFEGIEFSGETRVVPPIPPVQPRPPVSVTPDLDCDLLAELDEFEILGATGGYLGSEDFIEFIDGAESGTLQRRLFEGKGPLVILLLVTLGGILLNLTPCVLPLIPINLAIIGAGAQAGSRARGFALGGTYGLAMAAVYGALGLIVILTASTFGAINSKIWFNIAIAILFVALGLAMFDVFVIDFSKLQGKLDLAGKGGRGTFALAFGMGAVAALLAGACVAPVVIQVIVYSSDQYAKGVTIALALPFFLGVGMALPWPFAGAGLSLLPKPGPWMVRVKQAMGVFILFFAAYYGYTAWKIYDSTRVDPTAVASAVQEHLAGGWTGSICDGLATARAEDKLVLIDMWATWCKNCLAMDKTTFKDTDVVARLEDYVKIKYQAEDLSASPNREMLERFEGIGLPTYAILRPRTAG
ncbi:MAG: protein-disulfide reductase DsbD family protein [Planctomycetota bacterium]|jgi:cytochrome c biogenesis protein CcdA